MEFLSFFNYLGGSTGDVLTKQADGSVAFAAPGSPGAHAADHLLNGSDEVNGDHLGIDLVPVNYTRYSGVAEATDDKHLAAHLAGIDNELGNLSNHAFEHIRGGAQEIDGDKIDIDLTPSYYTPSTSPSEVTHVDHLSAHLAGIDNEIGSLLLHASDHARGGSDEINGDHLDITFTPSNYTPSTSPAEATHVDHLAAHLAGIDDALGSGGSGKTPVVKVGGAGGTTDHGLVSGSGGSDIKFSASSDYFEITLNQGEYHLMFVFSVVGPASSDFCEFRADANSGTVVFSPSQSSLQTIETYTDTTGFVACFQCKADITSASATIRLVGRCNSGNSSVLGAQPHSVIATGFED